MMLGSRVLLDPFVVYVIFYEIIYTKSNKCNIMIKVPTLVDPEEYDNLKDFLLEKWGEQADSFPGEFHVWLSNWIKDVIEEGEDSDFYDDINIASRILVDELMVNCIAWR